MARKCGVTDWVRIADHSALTLPAGNWSFGGWVKINSNLGIYKNVVAWGTYAASPSCNLLLYGIDSGNHDRAIFRVHDAIGQGGWEWTEGDTFGATRTWQHFLAVRNGDIFTLYLDTVSHGDGPAGAMGEVDVNTYWQFAGNSASDFEFAEWAKWDSALSAEQITALANGVRPPEVGTRPAWYVPMLGSLEEQIAGLTVTQSGTTISEHPPKIVPRGQMLAVPTGPIASAPGIIETGLLQ